MDKIELYKAAIAARELAYAPYSEYMVGAALIAKSGKIYTGCNIENASYSACNCAERTAIFKAVSAGEHNFIALAVCAGKKGEGLVKVTPCGVCRQVMREFCVDDFSIFCVVSESEATQYTLKELLPHSFGSDNL